MQAKLTIAILASISAMAALAASGGDGEVVDVAAPKPELRCDGDRDTTSAIVAATRNSEGVVVVPPNCRFDRAKLLREIASGAILLDLSTINGFASPGETTKSIGILSRDSAESDSQWLVGSGHHPVLNLNNYGSVQSSSGQARRASLLWSGGDFSNGASKTGFRGAGLLQFGGDLSTGRWTLSLRSLAPFSALRDAGYEMWAPGEQISKAGVYRSTGQAILVSTNSGKTGAAIPQPLLGSSVRDGSVSWRYIDSADRSIMQISEHGRVLFGLGDFEATFRHKVSVFDPGNNVVEWAAAGPSKDVIVKLLPTNAQGGETRPPGFRASASASASGSLAVVSGADYATPLARFDNSRGLIVARSAMDGMVSAPADGALPVAGAGLVFVRAASSPRVARLTGGVDGQIIQLHFLSEGTLEPSDGPDTMRLEGSRPLRATRDTVVSLRKMPLQLGGYWVEISRSVK